MAMMNLFEVPLQFWPPMSMRLCVNCHPKFEFLNESVVEHVIIWFVLTFFIYVVHIVHDRGKGIAQYSKQPQPIPTHDTQVDEALVIYVQIVCTFMFIL